MNKPIIKSRVMSVQRQDSIDKNNFLKLWHIYKNDSSKYDIKSSFLSLANNNLK